MQKQWKKRSIIPRLGRSLQRLNAQIAAGRPTRGREAGALEGGCPEQKRPQSMSFPLFPELNQQGRESGAKKRP